VGGGEARDRKREMGEERQEERDGMTEVGGGEERDGRFVK
jgi:hypothetical protein